MALGSSVGDAHGGLHVPGNQHESALRQEHRSVGHQPAHVTLNSFGLSAQVMLSKQSNNY